MRAPILVAAGLICVACGPLPNQSTGVYLTGLRSGSLTNLTSDGAGGLVHVLLLMPYGSGPGSNGSGFKVDWTSASEEEMWREGGTERRFSFAYRLLPRRAEIGGKTWSLETQNVFVVRLDDQWRTSVEALPLQTYSASSLEVLKRIQDLLPQDREITSLKVME